MNINRFFLKKFIIFLDKHFRICYIIYTQQKYIFEYGDNSEKRHGSI